MQDVQDIIDRPDMPPEFSTAILNGDELVVTVNVPRQFPKKLLIILLSVAAVTAMISICADDDTLVSCGLLVLFLGLGFYTQCAPNSPRDRRAATSSVARRRVVSQ